MFKWVDPEWDARTKGILVKLMKRKPKDEEEARSWEEAWRIAKKDVNDTIYEMHMTKRYIGETTIDMMNATNKIRNDAVQKELGMGNCNSPKAENDTRM